MINTSLILADDTCGFAELGAGSNVDSVIITGQILKLDILANLRVQMNLHTGLLALDISSQELLGQAIFREYRTADAAGSALRLKHINLTAGKCQTITAGQSAGTGTDDSDTLAVLGPYRLLYKLAVICFYPQRKRFTSRIATESSEAAAVTGGLARMRADSAANRREKDCLCG